MNKVLLVGPKLNVKNSFYGQGKGGYTRNMEMYLNAFKFDNYRLVPFFATVRIKGDISFFSFPSRFLKDVFGIIRSIYQEKPRIVHILGQYRGSVFREVAWIFISKLTGRKVIYEVKAGQFIKSIEISGFRKRLYAYLIKASDHILVEGRAYKHYLKEEWNQESTYFPNVVADSEIINMKRAEFLKEPLKVLFVGFAYEGKGIFSILEGLQQVQIPISFTIIGGESEEFSEFMQHFVPRKELEVIRKGAKPHADVLSAMQKNDIYIYPSKHPGEGHNNTINEALMCQMIIIASKTGFLEDVLKDVAYLLDEVSPSSIAAAFADVYNSPAVYLNQAKNGGERLRKKYTSTVAMRTLEEVYRSV